MADFCNICANKMFGDKVKPDIDVPKIFNVLQEGYCMSVLCEGCGLSDIAKEEGNLLIRYYEYASFQQANLKDYKIFCNKRFKFNI